ncbi:hypothetical protein CHUAL_001712 [Chamberlinius hualienensis]
MEFAEDWDMVQTLGEGAYGEVKLLVNRKTGESVAAKILDVTRDVEARENIRKEVCIHRLLNDEHIIKYYGQRQHGNLQYIFLEYAAGGELFDRIEPDVGMSNSEAARYFSQLIGGVEYLHSRGIAHRDLKPENLLLDSNDKLRITDFGMATLFRNGGEERLLQKRCGTLPYIAPEVLLKEYRAEPADLWSCGIILVALLAGELPWDAPASTCIEYCKWKKGNISNSPWTKISTLPLSLLKKMLIPIPAKRYTISDIKTNRWLTRSQKSSDSPRRISRNDVLKRLCSGISLSASNDREAMTRLSMSQPHLGSEQDCEPNIADDVVANNICFSQPVHPEHMILSTQTATQSNSQTLQQKFVKRMTRFFVTVTAERAQAELKRVFAELFYSIKTSPGMITVTTVDRRGIELVFKVSLIEMNGKILVDFRLSKGDGIEFKKMFIHIKLSLQSFIVPGPITWPIAIATNTVP